MRALIAAATGLVLAFALVLTITPWAHDRRDVPETAAHDGAAHP